MLTVAGYIFEEFSFLKIFLFAYIKYIRFPYDISHMCTMHFDFIHYLVPSSTPSHSQSSLFNAPLVYLHTFFVCVCVVERSQRREPSDYDQDCSKEYRHRVICVLPLAIPLKRMSCLPHQAT